MQTKVLLLVALLTTPLGCELEPQEDGFVNPFQFLVPVASVVAVRVGGSYDFTSINPEAGGEPLGNCTISLGAGPGELGLDLGPIPETVLANFQRAVPRGSDDFFSIQIQGDFVSWGLFARGPVEGRPDALGKEWSNRPDGALEGECKFDDDLVECRVFWEGEATENFTQEDRAASVTMTCLFVALPEPPCFETCADDNPCTVGVCAESECQQVPIAFLGSEFRVPCEVEPGVEGFCLTDGNCRESPPNP